MDLNDLLIQIFQQYGLVGLILFFLITGPGYTYLRTKSLRVQSEARAQELVNEFAKQERQRAERLEVQLTSTRRKLDAAEDEVGQMRLKLSEARTELTRLATLQRQLRRLRKRVEELESQVEEKRVEIESLRFRLDRRETQSPLEQKLVATATESTQL